MAELVSVDEVRQAAGRVRDVIVRTPLLPVPAARPVSGRPLLVKPESLQPTGSFKLRGAYNAISVLLESAQPGARPAGVVAHSSGNHGFAVAYAAALLGIPAAIVVPETAPAVKTSAIMQAGAELVTVEGTLNARVAASGHIAETRGYAEIPPFDHPQVIAGQGTIGLEIADDFTGGRIGGHSGDQPPAAILVPVGGGGLVSGIAVAVKALLPGTRVIGVEPELAADARESFRKGVRVRWPATDTARTKADSLRVEQVGEVSFPHMREFVDDIITVTEDELLEAVRRLATQARLVAEPGGAVAVAAALFREAGELGLPPLDPPASLVAVVSGGNIDPALLAEVLRS